MNTNRILRSIARPVLRSARACAGAAQVRSFGMSPPSRSSGGALPIGHFTEEETAIRDMGEAKLC